MISGSQQLHSVCVAAAFLAATLPLPACGVDTGDASREATKPASDTRAAVASPPASSSRQASALPLATRWLIPPDPDQDPPLAAPAGLAIDEGRGRLYLLDLRPPELRVYAAADGAFLGRLAREGGGPGELRAPMSLAVGAGGVVAVVSVDGRVSFWSPAGSFTGLARLERGLATDIVAIGSEGFLVKIDRFPPADVSEFHLVATNGARGDVRFRDDRMPEPAGAEPGRRNHTYALAGGGEGELFISAAGPEYRILRVSTDGRVIDFARRSGLAPPVRSPEEIAALRSRIRRGFQVAGRRVPALVAVPEHRPHVLAMAADPDGDIWALTGRGAADSSLIDRFDAEGVFVASYLVRLRVADLATSSESIYLLASGDQDVPGVAVAGRPPSGGSTRDGRTGEGAR